VDHDLSAAIILPIITSIPTDNHKVEHYFIENGDYGDVIVNNEKKIKEEENEVFFDAKNTFFVDFHATEDVDDVDDHDSLFYIAYFVSQHAWFFIVVTLLITAPFIWKLTQLVRSSFLSYIILDGLLHYIYHFLITTCSSHLSSYYPPFRSPHPTML